MGDDVYRRGGLMGPFDWNRSQSLKAVQSFVSSVSSKSMPWRGVGRAGFGGGSGPNINAVCWGYSSSRSGRHHCCCCCCSYASGRDSGDVIDVVGSEVLDDVACSGEADVSSS